MLNLVIIYLNVNNAIVKKRIFCFYLTTTPVSCDKF